MENNQNKWMVFACRPQKYFLILLISVIMNDFALAQKIPAKKDSSQLYKNIEAYSKRSKFNRMIYRLIFKPIAVGSSIKKIKKKSPQSLYSLFEGKIIRNINIVTLDPFGFSVNDTTESSQNFFTKSGNWAHIKSQPITIRNLLLIHKNQVFDSLLVKESERLIRSRGYVHNVSFVFKATSEGSDSVDINIRELDNWSLIPNIDGSPSHLTFYLTDKNFLGAGHEFLNRTTWYRSTGDFTYYTNYFIPNFRNTFINATLHYGNDKSRNYTRSIIVDRPFFSPFAKWAAGLTFMQQFRKDPIHINDSLIFLRIYKYNTQDYWAGSAIQIFKGHTEIDRTTNFVSAIRFLKIRYLETPIKMLDSLHYYSDENLYLATVGISTRIYVQDKFIFDYGRTEDVPVGKVYSLTAGYQEKNNIVRSYFGARVSSGRFYPWGYVSSNCEYGIFFHGSHAQQGILSISVIYFTELLELGNWKFRQFVKPQLTLGINRTPYDSLTINDGYGLDGFNSPELSGTSRAILTLQTQFYAPWNVIGFHFGPYLIYSIAMLGVDKTAFQNSHLYSQIGIGVLIKNEYLVLNSFHISLAFYPIIPGKGRNVFKANSFRTDDFRLRDFEIGKPSIVQFQ